MTNTPVGWFEIYVQGMERAEKFYETVLQTTLQKLNTLKLRCGHFPWPWIAWVSVVPWLKCRAFPPAKTARWFTSVALTALQKRAVS